MNKKPWTKENSKITKKELTGLLVTLVITQTPLLLVVKDWFCF